MYSSPAHAPVHDPAYAPAYAPITSIQPEDRYLRWTTPSTELP